MSPNYKLQTSVNNVISVLVHQFTKTYRANRNVNKRGNCTVGRDGVCENSLYFTIVFLYTFKTLLSLESVPVSSIFGFPPSLAPCTSPLGWFSTQRLHFSPGATLHPLLSPPHPVHSKLVLAPPSNYGEALPTSLAPAPLPASLGREPKQELPAPLPHTARGSLLT